MATSIQQNIHTFLDDIRRIIDAARTNAVRSVEFCRVQMYWQMGQRILEEEQQGKDRADYGSYLIKTWQSSCNRNMEAAFLYASSNVADNFTDFIQLRPHCGRN